MKKLITHNGPFHTDDLLAAAVFEMYLDSIGETYELIRSRDNAVIESGDIVFDVGRIYDPSRNRFDHHQTGGAGERENKIPYASIGLAWKHYGIHLCNDRQDVWQEVEEQLIQPIDADDVGISLYDLDPLYDKEPFLFKHVMKSFYPSWDEQDNFDQVFNELLPFAKSVLKNAIRLATARFKAALLVEEAYEKSEDKKIIILSDGYPWKRILTEKAEPLFVIYPTKTETWNIQTVPVSENEQFNTRAEFPEAWAGLDGEVFEKASGVDDAIFCHNNRWLCGAKTKEAAIQLAKKALLM